MQFICEHAIYGYALSFIFLEDLFTGFWAVVSTSAAAAQAIDGTIANMFLLVGVHLVYIIFGVLMLKDKKREYIPLVK